VDDPLPIYSTFTSYPLKVKKIAGKIGQAKLRPPQFNLITSQPFQLIASDKFRHNSHSFNPHQDDLGSR
jgi:hypothetical protein